MAIYQNRYLPKEADVRTSFAQQPAQNVDWCDVARVTIDMLPDVALLDIFGFYQHREETYIEDWHNLVHVCRKWRDIVFGSPRRLDLRLFCKPETPVRETLYVWPVLPIVIWTDGMWDADNIIAALEHNDRICRLELHEGLSSEFEKVIAAMQQPFPALTHLWLWPYHETAPVADSFLGGSAPLLQSLTLMHIPFPGLPNLLLSATHLTSLDLYRIPHSGYISPEVMVTCLSVLTSLNILVISFESPRSCPDRKSRRPPPLSRTLLPALTYLLFQGVSEYLEDLVARIDAPLLIKLHITFFNDIVFDTPELAQFISRTPKFKAHDKARLVFDNGRVCIQLPSASDGGELQLRISCGKLDWQLSSLAQICSSSFPQALITMVEHLYIQCGHPSPPWEDDIENSQWLEVLHPFTAVKNLYISRVFMPQIARALQELVVERVTVLPSLHSLFLEEPESELPDPSEDSRLVQESIGQFVSARQLAGHPITISHCDESHLKNEVFLFLPHWA
jgi:hypothetical protein